MKNRLSNTTVVQAAKSLNPDKTLLSDIRSIIESARSFVAQTVNSSLVMLYWKIGKRIKQDVLRNKRAGYGERIVATLSRQLTGDYGHSFSEKNLRRMIQFFEVFSDEKIVVSLIRQLTWTRFIALIPLEDPLQRDFYAEMCRLERWNVRTLQKKIDGMLYERTALFFRNVLTFQRSKRHISA